MSFLLSESTLSAWYSGLSCDHQFINKRMLALEQTYSTRETRLTSTEVWAAATSKDWRDYCRTFFPPSYLRRQNEALLAGWAFFWLKVPQVPGTAGSAVTFGLSINRCSHSKKPVWHEKTGLTSTEVWAAMTSKDWRDKGRASCPLLTQEDKMRNEAPEAGCHNVVPHGGGGGTLG